MFPIVYLVICAYVSATKPVKNLLLAVIFLTCAATATPRASAQSGMFVYTGIPTVPVAPGRSFTVGVNLMVSGMTGPSAVGDPGVNDLSGLNYWMAQSSPAGGPFPFQITNRDYAGSLFNNGSGGLFYPQIIDPINRNPNGTTFSTDLGLLIQIGHPGLPNGTSFIANITFHVSATAPSGTYTISNTTAATPNVAGRISLWNDADGDTAPIAASSFTVSVMPFAPTQVVSRKSHNGVPFDINLPLTGTSGIECRSGGPIDGYQMVFTFANPVTFNSAAVTAGAGTINSTSGNGTTAVSVNLANVNNAQRVTVMLAGVSDGLNTGDFSVPMGVLVGDSNGDGVVNSGDSQQARNRSGQVTDATNFFSDINLDGFINSGDWTIVRARAGTALP